MKAVSMRQKGGWIVTRTTSCAVEHGTHQPKRLTWHPSTAGFANCSASSTHEIHKTLIKVAGSENCPAPVAVIIFVSTDAAFLKGFELVKLE